MVGRWSFPFWGWPILKASLHVNGKLPPSKKTVASFLHQKKYDQKNWVSQGKAAILCLVELYLSVGEAGIWGEFSTRNPVRVNSPNWGEGKGWNPMILQGFGCTIPGGWPWDFWTINSMMSLRWSSEFLFTGKSGVERKVVKRSKIKIPVFFPIEVHCRWCGDASKNLVGQKPTDGGCNGGLSEGIDAKSIEAGGHVTWLHSLWLHWGR